MRLIGGDLSAQAERAFVRALAGSNPAAREAIFRKPELLWAELLGPGPTPAERVATCWLQVQDADVRYAQAQDGLSPCQAEYHQRRMDAVTCRYLSALKTLAQVRRLAVPVLQANIARKQVNVAGAGIATK